MLLAVLFLVIASVSAQDAETTACAKQCMAQYPFAYGQDANMKDQWIFNLTRESDANGNRWFDPKDPKDRRDCGGRTHSAWWYGARDRTTGPYYTDKAYINYFQILTKVEGKEQIVLVYINNKLIDIVKDPAHGKEAREDVGYSNANFLNGQHECIWNCLSQKAKKYAPLDLAPSVRKAGQTFHTRTFSSDMTNAHYNRVAAPGPAEGYWTLSIRTNYEKGIRVETHPYDAALADEKKVQTLTANDIDSQN